MTLWGKFVLLHCDALIVINYTKSIQLVNPCDMIQEGDTIYFWTGM